MRLCCTTSSFINMHLKRAASACSFLPSGCSHLFLSVLSGEYQKSCTECEPCPAGSYTTGWNREDRCDRCSGDCRAGKEAMSHFYKSVPSNPVRTVMTAVTFVFFFLYIYIENLLITFTILEITLLCN